MSVIKLLLIFICLFLFSSIQAEVASNSLKIKEYSDLQMTEFVLKNGMRLILKTTDDSEISIRLAAVGGYALNPDQHASSALAAAMVIESGMGDLCADKLSAFLYDHSIEFNLKIEPFTRSIDATLPEESLASFFFLVNKTFTAPKFNPEIFPTVVAKKRNELAQKGNESSLDDILSLISLKEKSVLHSLKTHDLEKANFFDSRDCFLKAFSNPGDFVCVIVGDIDVEKVKELAEQNLSNIPSKNSDLKLSLPNYSYAPKLIATRTQNLPHSEESLVRLALPLQMTLDNAKVEHLELACHVIETRLRNLIKASHAHEAKGVDVWYELPLYPSLDYPWMTIQFHAKNEHIKPTIALILEELNRVANKGFESEEIRLAASMKRQSLQLWEHDNDYWILLLSNHYMWGWDPQRIAEKYKNPALFDQSVIHTTIHSALLMNEYSFPSKK